MNITTAIYIFETDEIIFNEPEEITKETNLYYYTKYAKYLKSRINKPFVFKTSSYYSVVLYLINSDKETLRKTLYKWFTDKANKIK